MECGYCVVGKRNLDWPLPAGFRLRLLLSRMARTALQRESRGHRAEPGLSGPTLLRALGCTEHIGDLWKTVLALLS